MWMCHPDIPDTVSEVDDGAFARVWSPRGWVACPKPEPDSEPTSEPEPNPVPRPEARPRPKAVKE